MKKLYLSKTDRKILGVCGGLGEILSVDSTIIRLALVFLCLLTGILPLVVTYIVAGIITPEKPQKQQKDKNA
jgi:phage shock protein PspC (stress-responsive transcriptional regulator)